jgi:feruloyl-CoA synthase
MSAIPGFRHANVGGCLDATVDRRADGSVVLRSTEALRWYPPRLSDCLERYAQEAPERVFAAQRAGDGEWRELSYARMLDRARSIGQALVDLGLSADRPIAILSDNDLEHLSIMMGAMWAGVPTISISTAYSLVSVDHGKLRHIASITTPGAVYASGERFGDAIRAAFADDVTVILGDGALGDRPVLRFDELAATTPAAGVDAAHDATGPDTIVKFLFTSGSTRMPKGVVNTNEMLCANQQMIRQCLAFLADEPPVLVDWLPWSHTFGGNHNVGIALYNGGTLYIDEGKPTPALVGKTLRNLREVSPTVYFNVPKGYEEIALAMDHDDALRESLFRRVEVFMYAGAGLSQAVWDKFDAHGVRTAGERVRMITSFGMTETAPACLFKVDTEARSGYIGLPVPGVEVKLVALGDKSEVRFRGPNVMPGYWRDPQQTAQAFDEEGYYRTGDAVKWVDPADHRKGLMFDGRIAEDFKLATGTFVSVGPLRARVIAMGEPCVQDVVVAGADRNEVALMIFPREDQVRRLAGLEPSAPLPLVLHAAPVRDFFQELADRLWREGTGSANRPARMHVLAEPPSIDKGEVTDKGSINQRAVLACREPLVEAMYAGRDEDPFLIVPRAG